MISPTCPPLSVPSAISASTPVRAKRFASATDATTGITLVPISLNAGIYSPGFPALLLQLVRVRRALLE